MPSAEGPGVLLIGARSVRQGTGPFIAAGLEAAGARVNAIVGTSTASVDDARQSLEREWQISPRTYTDLARALEMERPEAVAICSPWRFHREHLELVAQAGCHALVEKPLVWPASEAEVRRLLAAFEERGLLLQLVAQWPCTLPSFCDLHGALPDPIDSFSMRLSPISIGPDMVTDSAPHFISLLQALLGPGDCEAVRMVRTADGTAADSQLDLHCRYVHARGSTQCHLLLRTGENRPRPAWYQINELRADREVELPEYRQYFSCGARRVPLADPMHRVAAAFVRSLQDRRKTDTQALRTAHRNLLQLAVAWQDS